MVGFVAYPDEGGLVGPGVLHVDIETIVGSVGLAADEPLGEGGIPVENPIPLLEPVQLLGPALPKAFVILRCLLPDLGVFDVRVLGKLLRWRIGTATEVLVAVLVLFTHRFPFCPSYPALVGERRSVLPGRRVARDLEPVN